ncbi:Vacuolar protein sorting-associated protein 70 [Tieghemiomyces parasiticus]|uniref:Vacuolar protein sorting-associated protein 70 n=1 Tax=Tieghemiomyces parasiticus TaxID=78921 RepID=A0A9W8AGE9_9FUNG|nr:Vacuolar protein sorting-associated protein 70 [Tieghemiomyces parasiticus]
MKSAVGPDCPSVGARHSTRARYIRHALVTLTLAAGLVLFTFWFPSVVQLDPVAILSKHHHPSPGGDYGPTLDAYRLFQALPDPQKLRDRLQQYASSVHQAGVNRTDAEWTRSQWLDFGLPEVDIVTYEPLLNYPLEQRLAIVEPASLQFEADLNEAIIDEDDTSHLQREIPPVFHGHSASGDVTAELVYANYGTRGDFAQLARRGVAVKGRIVLVRYGRIARGVKVMLAEAAGAAGVLIYSDPADDGYARGPVYPDGPFRPAGSVERGSVLFMNQYPGDPLTPGEAATGDVKRLPIGSARNLPTIPSLPISYGNALPLLRALAGHGHNVSDWAGGWSGALPVTYATGPSTARIQLVNRVRNQVTPIWNVVARIKGWQEPDRVVIAGSHRDSWVFGAADPGSGTTTLFETARALGVLLRAGWRPRRTIILASWDAEEYGLTGSTEWVEDHRDWLRDKAVAYLNLDVAVYGPHFIAGASPSLVPLIYNVTRGVTVAGTNQTVYDEWVDRPEGHYVDGTPYVTPLGSGSDYTPFLQHAGIASVDFSFAGPRGLYHSAYDSFHNMAKHVDPDFRYHQAATRVLGGLLLRLADLPVVPLNLTHYATALRRHVAELELAIRRKMCPGEDNLMNPLECQRDPTVATGADAATGPGHRSVLDLGRLYKAVDHLTERTTDLHHDLDKLTAKAGAFCDRGSHKQRKKCRAQRATLNARLYHFECQFLRSEGIPSRPWFKHTVYAPGIYTGYSALTLPILRESVEEEQWDRFLTEMDAMVHLLHRAADFVKGKD